MTMALDVLARLIRNRIWLLAALGALAVAGSYAVDGWSATTVIVAVITVLALALFGAIASFWLWVFRNSGQRRSGP